jgi:DNA repair protein RecO (recombination protein O)
VEVLSRDHGRLGLLARGARRERSPVRGALQPFRPLFLSWSGRSELMTLAGVEPVPATHLLAGQGLLSGLYLNELVVRLLPRHDPHPDLFHAYSQAIARLAEPELQEEALRVFEKRLLEALGYGMGLAGQDWAGRPIDPRARYVYEVERGAVPCDAERESATAVNGETLLALGTERLVGPDVRREAKRLMRLVLAHHLGERPLRSRELFPTAAARRGPDPAPGPLPGRTPRPGRETAAPPAGRRPAEGGT